MEKFSPAWKLEKGARVRPHRHRHEATKTRNKASNLAAYSQGELWFTQLALFFFPVTSVLQTLCSLC